MKNTHSLLPLLSLILLSTTSLVAAPGNTSEYRNLDNRECPILDTPFAALSALEFGYTPPARTTATGWDKTSVAELTAWVRCCYFENTIGSDFEMRMSFDSFILNGFDGSGSGYPLCAVTLPMTWSQRYDAGWGLQLQAEPGLFTTLQNTDGDSFAVPVGLRFIKACSPNFAFFFGARAYPQFDQVADPWAGLHWSVPNVLLIELAYPETRMAFGPADGCRFVLGGRILTWPEYSMGKDDSRKRILYDETRAHLGFEWSATEYTEFSLQTGYIFDRTVNFEENGSEVEIEDAVFVRFGIRGRM